MHVLDIVLTFSPIGACLYLCKATMARSAGCEAKTSLILAHGASKVNKLHVFVASPGLDHPYLTHVFIIYSPCVLIIEGICSTCM